MCWNQILVILGLIFEFLSVAMTQNQVFRDITKYLKEEIQHERDSKYTITAKIDKPWFGRTAFALLIVGMAFQGWSVFV